MKKIIILAISSLLTLAVSAQEDKYLVTVPVPEGYVVETKDVDVVANNFTNDVLLGNQLLKKRILPFDTTGAIVLTHKTWNYTEIPKVEDDEIQDRLQCIQNQVPLNFHTKVRGFIDYFSVRNRSYSLKVLQKTSVYFPLFEKILADNNLPDELKYLSIVESGLNTRAISRAGAAGLWQFMPSTGRMFGLKQDSYIDQRLDPEEATLAACKYLKSLHSMFGDWELALAAYNCGPGNIRKAQRRSGKFHFWDIYDYLPRETRSYVPQFVAVTYVLNYADEHNLVVDQQYFPVLNDTIKVNQYVNLTKLANILQVTEVDLLDLNPELKRSVLPAGHEYTLQIPYFRKEFFDENRSWILDSVNAKGNENLYSTLSNSTSYSYASKDKIYHKVRSGENLGSIAGKYRVNVSDLKRWNSIHGTMIKAGQKLVVYPKGTVVAQNTTVSKSTAHLSAVRNNTSSVVANPVIKSNAKIHVVREGDTLWDIANLYDGVEVSDIKRLNSLASSRLKIGQVLKLQ